MKNSLFKYFSLWGAFIRYFIFYWTIFILYIECAFSEANIETLLLSYLYRLKPDLSFSSYMILIPSLILALSPAIGPKVSARILLGSINLILATISIVEHIDLEVYSYWWEKFDAMHLRYLNDLKQITHTITSKTLVCPLLFSLLLLFYYYFKITTWLEGRFSLNFKIDTIGKSPYFFYFDHIVSHPHQRWIRYPDQYRCFLLWCW